MTKPVRHIRAGQLPPTDIPRQTTPVLRRIDADQLQQGGIYFSEPPEHVSTPDSRKERASVWRRVVLPTAIVTASVLAALAIVFVK
jgi:anti-sigma-K factor RskA